LGILLLVSIFCTGTFLSGLGPLKALERLFAPTMFVASQTGSAGTWYEALFVEPVEYYDPDDFTGVVPEELLRRIASAQRSIDIAAFELDLTPVAEALIAAHNRGVTVRWVTDDEHGLDADSESGHGQFQMMRDAGIQVRDDDREGLMHDKYIIFDEESLWTGSTNITQNGMFRNDNNVIIIESPAVAEMYQRDFNERWRGKSGAESRSTVRRQTTMIDDTPVLVLFAPEDEAMESLLPLVHRAKESIYFMAFAFTYDDLGQELLNKARRGVDVRGVFESRNASSEHSEIHTLYCAGLDVREDGNPATMHHKVFVIDGTIVATGSFNFSNSANSKNDENMVLLNNADIAADYQREFERVWAQAWIPYDADMDCRR
jgi:phosphatidylserine/phosphatidylglycerophosphate/cardiolipin synthase-like enzyme